MEVGLETPRTKRSVLQVIGLATLLGLAVDYSPIDPIKALFWSAVLNGVIAVPIMAAMMVVVTRSSAMGRFKARPVLVWLGWTATALMGLTDLALLWSALR